jgi:hypothetical protein
LGLSLGGFQAVLQSSLFDGVAFDPFPFQCDGLVSTEVDIGWRQVLQAFVVAAVIVVLDEAGDPGLEVTGQVIVLEQDTVLERLVPALDLALGLRMARCVSAFNLTCDLPSSQWISVRVRDAVSLGNPLFRSVKCIPPAV